MTSEPGSDRFWLTPKEFNSSRSPSVDLREQAIFPMKGLLQVESEYPTPTSGIGQYRDATSALGHLTPEEWADLERSKKGNNNE